MNIKACLSSDRMDWETPPELVAEVAASLGIARFDLDAAASEQNAKALRWYDEEADGLRRVWGPFGLRSMVWCNPPYGREIGRWVEKAATEAREGRATVAMLIPARTDTRYWHAHIWDAASHRPREGVEVRFLPGRVRFVGAPSRAPFPSAIIIFHAREGA